MLIYLPRKRLARRSFHRYPHDNRRSGIVASDKFDLGANPAPLYAVYACIEMDVAPTVGTLVNLWLAWSPAATAGEANPAGLSGSDSAYTGYASNAADSIKQLGAPAGLMPMTVQIAPNVQVAALGYVAPTARYGMGVVQNGTGTAFEGDAVEMAIILIPIVVEGQ